MPKSKEIAPLEIGFEKAVRAVASGGDPKKTDDQAGGEELPSSNSSRSNPALTPVDMMNELILSGHIIPSADEFHFNMPSAYRCIPSVTTADSSPLKSAEDD